MDRDASVVATPGLTLLALGLLTLAFSAGGACHAVDDDSACQAHCYPTDIDQDARKTLGVCVCQGVVLP